jgi:hypothetical protein
MVNNGYFGAVLPEDCTLEVWKGYSRHLRRVVDELDRQGRELKETGGGLNEQQVMLAWAIGDWLLKAKKIGVKPGILRKHVREALNEKYAQGTLSNFMTVSKAFDFSRRRENVGFSHHLEIAKFHDIKIQEDLLNRVEESGMSVRRLKDYIKDSQNYGYLPKTEDGPNKKAPPPGCKLLKLWVPNSFYSNLQRWSIANFQSDGRRYQPAKMMAWLAHEYVKKHQPELDAMVAEYEVNQAEERKRDIIIAEDMAASRAARKAAEAEAREKAGLPNDLEFEEFRKRCAKLRDLLRQADKGGSDLFLAYHRSYMKTLGVPSHRQMTCKHWESMLAKLEVAGDPEALLHIVKSSLP